MKAKARLTDLADRLAGQPQGVAQATSRLKELVDAPGQGQNGKPVRITVSLPADLHQAVSQEAARRKSGNLSNPTVSAIIREAVQAYLDDA